MKHENEKLRFINAAIQIADANGRFDVAGVREKLAMVEKSVRRIAISLQEKGLLIASYGDNWQLTGDARDLAERHAVAIKQAESEESARKAKLVPRKLIPRKRPGKSGS